jgi:hypothetical protein
MSHTPEQKALAVLIAKREKAEQQLTLCRQRVHVLGDVEQAAQKAEAEAQARLNDAAAEKVRTGNDTTAEARAAYQQAIADLAVAETEAAAGRRVILEDRTDLATLERDVHRQCAIVAKAIAEHEQPRLVATARAFGEALARHKSLIRFARAKSADSGLIADPIADIQNSNNPLKLQIDDLINGKDLEAVALTEQAMLDAKIGGSG